MYIKTLTVTQLNNYIKKTMDGDFILKNVSLKGEISNWKKHSSGHIYFSLKDESGKINCIMFKEYADGLDFDPDNGISVEAMGRVTLYAKEGSVQLYCQSIKRDGVGDLFIQFEKLKKKLEEENLFSSNYKKSIPKFAMKVGVITSPTGAAIRDIINVAKRRNSKVELIIYPSLVQGDMAAANLIEGIKYFNEKNDVDLIILTRGGGSIEELWAFNNEDLARTIFKSKKPVICGVGHETDFTIADFVSDMRAPTPSAAAEIAIFNESEILEKLSYNMKMIKMKQIKRIDYEKNRVNLYKEKLQNYKPINYIANEYFKVDYLNKELRNTINSKIDKNKTLLSHTYALLQEKNPLNIINKGYSIIRDSDQKTIKSISILKEKKEIEVILADGREKFYLEMKREV
ncbi:exodeoxyribonuclease VII large subunit [Clostridium grantii]|uniref:Exodeoxyribonuclease 7 large subunit n=1 Tax=Clostridium grantii DSM 8605 TaxID=1121316 RepID=A0A1M5SFL9_9CLOT|nr:exodeoxyribonuclease VII large subunit [Clostridium grantii]SHH37078.1 Exodeoxyribonuclease VII large subunit [Clostridium grantii DSM 8605]